MIVAITGSRDNVGTSVVQRGLQAFLRQCSKCGGTPEYAGSVDHLQEGTVELCVGLPFQPDELEFRCGDARGVDLYARDWLRRNGYTVDVYCASDAKADELSRLCSNVMDWNAHPDCKRKRTPYRRIHRCSDWERDGKQAGNQRNAQMLQRPELAHLLIKFHDGSSPGTRNCADMAEQLGIEVVDGVRLARGGGK